MTDLSPASSEDTRLFAFPSARLALGSFVSALFLSSLFGVVYGGADYLTAMRTKHVRIDFSFEQNIPFIPELSPVYSSLYVLFLFVPFVLRSTQQLRSYVFAMTAMTLVAGVCFLLISARLGFVSPPVDQVLPFSFRIADQLNLTYNPCPSLHAAYAVFHAQIFGCRARQPWLFHLWAFAIAAAAWFTHQHHLVDLLAGALLGISGGAVYNSLCRRTAPHR
ncbi:MAG: hypothetical protein JNM43_01860 [Planctomycetaceae bacterium]|nr:hypothetical protein [Planctomycetaceae bacterium]